MFFPVSCHITFLCWFDVKPNQIKSNPLVLVNVVAKCCLATCLKGTEVNIKGYEGFNKESKLSI